MIEHVDVLIVGAGLSGIGAACHLRRTCPGRRMAILEARHTLGGTWDLFRYPGVRSDSDMYTLGYSFRPWTAAAAFAAGDTILDYLTETAAEFGVDRQIRYGHTVVSADFSADFSAERAHWTVRVRRSGTEGHTDITCSLLYVCTGYYRYDQGHVVEFPGADRFAGPIVHPQHWPTDLDCAARRVVVIGSGATAVTLVPALAARGAQVTMLQRSPSYVAALPATDPLAHRLRARLPARWVHSVLKWKNVLGSTLVYQASRHRPQLVRWILRRDAIRRLPTGFAVDTHFNPRYAPWDQRLCVAPDGDLFAALRAGSATMVTDEVDSFDESGVRLRSGAHLDADIIVTATGLELLMLGGMELSVNGTPVRPADTVAYRGMMLSGVPNFVFTVGYTNASWTLKADLVAHYACRLLRHLESHGYTTVTPTIVAGTSQDRLQPFIDLRSGYVLRGIDQLPRQGRSMPWRLHQDYLRDLITMRWGRLTDSVRFTTAGSSADPRRLD